MAAIDDYNIATDPTFLNRVEALLIESVKDVVGEDTSGMNTSKASKRHDHGTRVLRDPSPWRDQYSIAVATNPSITSTSASDADIKFTINSVFDDFAGVTYDENQ